ncbi:ABC transporter substrate-binding protein [Phaeovibrio sulfidiphilus]|uniref:ABC transporter substrate-binding protein n=1 Tax=Phaeovibrio sulfidiphilus TaxID=1220600 RepID=A0A8J7CW81_9PROT|nr:ABC transporter substrate-binding protein [Phaeovibrio sulfidiphilus]MBE1237171.1 ABC transporter substrate-binding protein [Phaeovibrio sulfidiphilus]
MFRRALAPMMAVFLMVGLSAPASAQQFSSDPKAFVDGVTHYAIDDILTPSLTKDEQMARFAKLVDTAFNMDYISRFVTGAAWRQATDAQRAEFSSLFREMNIYTWGQRFNEYDNQTIEVTGVKSQETRGGTIHEVTSTVSTGKGKPIIVNWVALQPATGTGGLGLIDIKVEGVSMLQTFRSDYQAVLKNTGSMDGLNAVLREKVAALKDGTAPLPAPQPAQ